MKKIYFIVAIIFFAIGGAIWYVSQPQQQSIAPPAITSFRECADAGHPIAESYPRQCRTLEGTTFIEDIGNELEKQDLIRASNPRPNQSIASPLAVQGEARGTWFFEASFPVKIFDDKGFLLGAMPAQAQGEWMTENFVPFLVDIPFAVPSTPKGVVIFEKDNPSGLSEHDDSLRVPVTFEGIGHEPKNPITIKIFLSDAQAAGEPPFDCARTVAVERNVADTRVMAQVALEALLRGATEEERTRGLVSSIPSGARVRTITIANRTATVDFDSQLEYQMGGSCRVAAVRAQIVDTLKQFPNTGDVRISVNGRTEDILQP